MMTHKPLSVFFFSLRLSSISEAFEILYSLMPRRPYFFARRGSNITWLHTTSREILDRIKKRHSTCKKG